MGGYRTHISKVWFQIGWVCLRRRGVEYLSLSSCTVTYTSLLTGEGRREGRVREGRRMGEREEVREAIKSNSHNKWAGTHK